jgi:hypothetical protein
MPDTTPHAHMSLLLIVAVEMLMSRRYRGVVAHKVHAGALGGADRVRLPHPRVAGPAAAEGEIDGHRVVAEVRRRAVGAQGEVGEGLAPRRGVGIARRDVPNPPHTTHDTVRGAVKKGGWKGRAGGVRWDERAVEVPHTDPPRGPLERVDATARSVERRAVRVGQRINAASLHRPKPSLTSSSSSPRERCGAYIAGGSVAVALQVSPGHELCLVDAGHVTPGVGVESRSIGRVSVDPLDDV